MTDQHTSISGAEKGSGSGLAVASLILGILGFCTVGVTGIIALILGGIALSSGRRQGGGGGRGMAIAGMTIGGISLVAGPVLILGGLLLPALGKARAGARQAVASSQLQQVGTAASLYAMESDGHLPPADEWIMAMDEYLVIPEELLVWPGDVEEGRAFAMNAAMGGRILDEIARPGDTVLFFECAPGSPPAGGPELLPASPRGFPGYLILLADGERIYLAPDAAQTLIWDPAGGDAE